ncbi:MAG TPA: ATP-binding protein [Rhizomicrobium sp.]|jgi:serine/threonine-protein kinase RsbW
MAEEVDLDFPATTRGLQTALQAIETACTGWEITPDIVARARVVFEELFTNTVKYGYGGECERPIWLRIAGSGGILCLTYEDEGPTFDPTRWKPEEPVASPLDNTREGLSGIAMVLGLSKTAAYARLADRNRITIMLSPEMH